MDIQELLKDLRNERDRVTAAIQALESVNGSKPANHKSPKPGQRNMSAEGRARIAAAAKKRWAAARRAGKTTLAK